MGIEIPAGLQWVSYLAGEQWPKGDETAMFQIGDDWNSSSQQISDLIPKLQQAQSQTASAVSGQTASAVAGQFQSLLSGDTSIQTLVSSMSSLGSLATQTGTQIQYTKLQILSTLGIAAAEIAYALSSVEWTFGASLAWIPPIEGITIAVVRQLVSQLIKRLLAAVAETLTKTGLRQLVKDAVVGAAVGAGIGIVQDLAIEAYQIHEGVRSGIDWGQVAEISVGAVVGGALGSVAHGLLSKSIGDPSTIGGKALKGAVTHFSVGAVGNVAGAGATGGGLNAEDIFGGAGGGAVSGGIHGGKEPPKGGAHGEKDSTSDTDTSPDDDRDDASIKTLVGPDSSELPNESNDHFPTNGPGPERDSASPPDGSTPPPAPQEPSAGPGGQPLEGDPSSNATASSAAGDTAASPGTADGLGAGRGVSTGEGQGSPSGSSAAGGAGAGVVSGGHDPAGAGGAGVGAGGAAASGGGSAGRGGAGSNGSGVGGHSGSAGVVDPAGASVAGRATVLSSGSAEGVARAGAVGSPNASVAGAGPDSRASRSGAASGSRSGPTAAAPAARVADTAAPKTGAGGKSGGAGQRSPEPGRLVAAQPSPGADRAAHGAGDPEEGNEFPDAVRPPVDMSQEAGHSEDSGASLPDTSDPAGRSKDSSATPSPDRSDHRPADRDDDPPPPTGSGPGRDRGAVLGDVSSQPTHGDTTVTTGTHGASPVGARSGDVLGDESWRHDPAVSADWFAPKDAVSPQQWEGRRGGAYVRSVDTEVADVKSESTPGRLTSYRGLIRYDLRRIEVAPNRFVQDYTLKVHLTPGSGVDADTVAAVRAKATAGVDGLLNRGFRLPSGDQFHVTVEFTDGPGEAHTTIEVGHTNTDQTHWNPKASASLLAHEALHYLGVPDEYVDSGRVLLRHDTNSGVHQGDGGMMGADVHGGDAGLRPRHLWIVERTANSQVAVPDTRLGDHHNPTTTARPHTPNTDTPTPNTRPTPTTNKPHTAPDGGDRRDGSEPARDRDTASDDARVSGWFDSDDDARVSGWFDSDDDARVSGWFDSGGESPTAPAGSDILHVSFDNVDGDRIERDIPTSFHPGSFGPTPPVPDPRFPTAQRGFDPTEPPVQITGVPQGQSVQHRTDTNFLFRDDHRGPLGAVDSPLERGFAVRDPSNSNLSQHVNGERNANFVSTSRDPNVAFNGPSNYKEEGRPNFRYIIHAPGGIEVNATLGPHRFGNQSEVAFPGGIRAQNIVGAQEIIGGTLRPGADTDIPGGQFENLQFGPFIPNRHFDPSAANPPGPDPRFARLTNNPGNDDSDSLFEASSSESSRPNTPPGPSRDNSGDGDSPVRRSPPPAANVPEAGPASASGSPTDVGSSAADPRLHQQVERTPNTDTPTPNTRPAPTASNALTGPDGGDRRDESESGQREPVREQLQRPKDAASRPSSLRHPMAVHSTDQLSGSASQPQRSDTDAGAGDPRHRDPAPSMPPDGQPARPDHHRSPSVGDTPRAVDPFIEALVPDEDRVSSAAGSSGHEEPEADSATRTPPPATSKPDATARASHSTADTEEDTSRPVPTEQPNRASASTSDRAGEPRPKSEAVARNADNHATRSTKPKDPAEPVREGSRRPTSDSEAQHEQSSTHPPPSQGLLHGFPPEDTGPADRPRSGGDVPALRLRGGAGERNRFRQTLNEYARRILGRDNHANSEDLVRGLNDTARRVQSEREDGSRPPAPERFGLDPFGLRDPSATPQHLVGRKLADVPISSLGEHIHALDMAKREGDPPPAKLDIWSEPVPPDKRWLSDNGDGRPSGPLPERLEMPAVFHSIWLGGPVTDGRKTTDLVRRNLEKLSKVAQRQGMRVVLWTDVPRTDFEHPGGDAAKMLSWARRHNISLLSPNEVFHHDEPMTLAAEYRLENAKGTAAGYTAASDMLRLEILHRFGGIYTDHDNQVRRLGGLRNLLGVRGFALHSRDDGIPNNSALLSARAHPFVKQYLEQIKQNYRLRQAHLHPNVHEFIGNTAKAQHENYVLKPALAVRRRSVTERTGPFNLKDVTESLNLDSADVPRIRTDQLDMGSAHTWLSTKPLRFAPEQTSRVLQHAISGLIWDLHNREGDLNLAAVAPLIEGLPDPAAGWKAVVDYMRSVPELHSQVQTVTYAYLRPKSNVPLIGDRLRIRQLHLPKSVLNTFGLPQHERATDLKGTWRRAAFAANIDPEVWRSAARASQSDDVEPLSFFRRNDSDSEMVLHGLAADDSATPDHAARDADDLVQSPQSPVHEADSTQAQSLSEPPTGSDRHSVDPSDSVHAERESVPGPDENTRPQSQGERRLSAFPESDTSIDEIRSWIGDVNNDGDAAIAPSGPRLENCAPATMVVFDRLSGTPSFGRAYVDGLTGDGRRIHELTRDELGKATGLPLERSSPQDIAERLVGQGPGAHTVVAIKYRNGEQHSFNAYFDGTQVHALDGQHGTIKPWPPALNRAKNPVEQWFLGTPPDSARSAPTADSGNGSPQRVLHSLPSDGPRADDLSGGSPDDLSFDPHSPPPSAQLDPALSLDSVTGIPDGHSAHIRTDNVRLYRDDTRSPSEVFGTGFAPLDPARTNLTSFVLGRPGAFVSTTRDAELNHLGPPTEARPSVFRYHIVAPGGIDVNPTLPHHQDGHEGEVAFLGGIRRENIVGAEQVLGGRPGPLQLGEFVRNDHFAPRTPNPHFPADPPREPTDSPDASDDDITPMNTPRARPASLPSDLPDAPGLSSDEPSTSLPTSPASRWTGLGLDVDATSPVDAETQPDEEGGTFGPEEKPDPQPENASGASSPPVLPPRSELHGLPPDDPPEVDPATSPNERPARLHMGPSEPGVIERLDSGSGVEHVGEARPLPEQPSQKPTLATIPHLDGSIDEIGDRIGDINTVAPHPTVGHGGETGFGREGLGPTRELESGPLDPGVGPSLHVATTEIRTQQDLVEVVERIAGPKRVVPTTDDPRDDPQACTVLLGKTMRALHPDRLATLPDARRTLDDSVLDGKPVSRLIGGAEPAPITSWEELDQRLRQAAEETGRATALILVQHPNAMGHALGAHRFADGRIAYFDLHRDVGDRVLVEHPRDLSLGRASAVFLDGAGQDVTRQARSSSLVDALIDPVGDPRYGRGGIEAEYRGGYLVFPEHLFDPDQPVENWHLNQDFEWLAKNDRYGLKVVIDLGKFDVTESGSRTMLGQAPFETVRDEVTAPVPEFVTDRPIAELRTDAQTNTRAAVANLQHTLIRLDDLARPAEGKNSNEHRLADILPASEGWELNPRAEDVRFVPVPTGDAATAVVHHTKGVPLGNVKRFMRSISQRIHDPELSDLHHDGEEFAQKAVAMFRRSSDISGQPDDRSAAVEQRELYGAMWLTYLHTAALALATTQPPGTAKHRSAVALRQSLRTVRDDLSPRVQDFLHDNAGPIREAFERQFLDREAEFSSDYVKARAKAIRVHQVAPKLHIEPPALAKGDETRPLDAVRYAALNENHGKHTLKVGDYLDTMLRRDPAITVDQYEAFGVHSHFPDLDRAGTGQRGLLLLELRNDSGGSLKPERLNGQYTELTRIVRDAVEPSAVTQLGRSLARGAKGLRNLARNRFEPPEPLSGASVTPPLDPPRAVSAVGLQVSDAAHDSGGLTDHPVLQHESRPSTADSDHKSVSPQRDDQQTYLSSPDEGQEIASDRASGHEWDNESARPGEDPSLAVLHGIPVDHPNTSNVRAARKAPVAGTGPEALSGLHADPRRLVSIPHSNNPIDDIRSWIRDVNNDGDPAVEPSGARLMNCGPATIAVFDRLSGTPSFGRAYVGERIDGRRANHELNRDELSGATGLRLVPSSPERIAQRLSNEEAGAHTVVAIRYRNGQQHSFNAYFDGTEVHALDGQRGTIKSWPPADLDREKNPVEQWFVGTPFDGGEHSVITHSVSDAQHPVEPDAPPAHAEPRPPVEDSMAPKPTQTGQTKEEAQAPQPDQPKADQPKADASPPQRPEPPQPEPQLPERIGDNLILGGTDVVEEFRSDDEGLKHIEQVVRELGGDAVWESNREQITALFSDDGLKPKVPGMLRGGHAPTRVINLTGRTTLTISLRLDGASEQSALRFKEDIKKYEFEHTSDSTNTVGTFSERRTQLYGVVQGNITHPKASDTATATGARSHDVALTNQRADRQISGGQTAEPATRFHGKIHAVITHRLNTSPDEMHSHDLAYRTQVAVPTRDVTDREEDRADETRDTVGPLPGKSSRPFVPEQPSGPPRVQYTHALSGSDIVTNFSLLADDGPEAQRPPVRAPRPQTIAAFVTSEPMQTAFAKAYGNKLGRLAMNETHSWLSVEQLQANLHGMTNKQPLVLNFEGIPGARLEVHAFVEPLDTPAKTRPPEGQTELGGAPSMMRATGTTKETEFHYGTETDTSQVHQDLVTWSAQLPTPGRFRGQGGTDAGEASGGLDGTFTRAQTHNETHTRQLRVRSTLKNPAPGQGWHGQVRLRFEMHTPDAVSPAGLGEPFKSAVHETRGRFDVLMEQSETTPTTDYLGEDVWAPPKRIWGTPPLQRNSVAKSPRWRLGGTGRATTDSRHGGPPRPANLPEAPEIRRGAGKENAVPLRGMGSMDRVTNLDLSGFHGMLDSMGHKAYGSGWKNARSDVSSWYHLNRVRGSLAAMSQHSPLSRPHSPGRGPKGKDSFTADFEQLTFRRVINTLSSPSAELTEGEAITTDRNRQTSVQGGLGGRGGDLNDSTILGEAIGGISQTVRDGERARNQQRVAVATKFDQPMAIFEGWVRLDGTMTGPRATVHESGLFPVEIAIPLTDLQGSRKHDASLPPTFTREIPTGFIDEPRPKPPPDPVDQAPLPRNPFAPKSIEHQGSPSTHGADARASTDQVPSAARPKPLQNISYVVDEDVRNNPDAYRLIDSPTTSDFARPWTVDSGPEHRGSVDSMLDDEGVVDRETPIVPRQRETVEIGPNRQGTAESEPERRSTADSTTPLLAPRQDSVDSVPDRRATMDAPPVDPPQRPLTDAADGTAPGPPADPVRPTLSWTAPPVKDGPRPPEHAFQQGWHPSDMLVGVDPGSGLLEAIRQDLAPALGSSLDEAIGGLSDQFGPSVLLARLTHESGQEWSHDIAVRGGKITVKVRPVRGNDPTDFEYVGPSKKFETDLSTESQSSTAHIYGNSLRTVAGGRIQIPVPHGSVSAQLTHITSVRPQEDIAGRADQGLGHLSNVDFPNFTGETEYRVPARVRTTEQHDLFRQPIHFEISYEQHVFGAWLKGVPEAPEPVRLSGTFSYPKEPPAAAGITSADEVRGQGNSPATPRIELQVDQAVVKIRPHIGRDSSAPGALPSAGSETRTAKEDLVAAHILDSMTTQGTAVFGTDWPQVRAELADHVKTMTVQRELGDYSHGGAKTILLKSVRGGEVVLGAHLDSLNVTDSTATTEFYSGGQQSLGAGVSNIKADAWQGYIQAQVDILPGHEALNVSALGRLNGGIGNETVDARTESSVTGNVFRKKVATLTHVGTATIEADMSRPTGLFGFGGDRISQVGTARVDFVTRESPTDKQDHALYVPRAGIIRNDEQGRNGDGLSRDSIVRKIANGADVRAHTLEKLRPLNIPNISRQVHSYLNDTRLASKLGAMTRVGEGESVEFLRRGDLRITARAEVQELKFVEIEHEGGNAYLLADITRTRLHQPTKTREAGGRVLFGPHWRLPGLQGSLLAGAGVTGRQRDAPIFSQTARVSANAKFPRSYAVFDGVSRVHLTVTYLGVEHELPPVDVHGPILIPQSETHPHIPDVVQHGVDSPDEALVAKPEPDVVTPDPQPPPVAGPSTVRPEGGPGDHVARPTEGEVSHPPEPDAPTEPSTHPESSTRSAGLPVAQTADAVVDASANRPHQPSGAGASTAPRASLSAPPAHPESSTHPAGLPTAHTIRSTNDVEPRSDEDEQALRSAVDQAVTRVAQRQPPAAPAPPTWQPVLPPIASGEYLGDFGMSSFLDNLNTE